MRNPKCVLYKRGCRCTEDSLKTVGTGCQRCRDYVVNVVIDAAPSQPAVVTFTNSGTATLGSDFTIATPASVTPNSGTPSAQTIRVFADNNFEGTETIQLGIPSTHRAEMPSRIISTRIVCSRSMITTRLFHHGSPTSYSCRKVSVPRPHQGRRAPGPSPARAVPMCGPTAPTAEPAPAAEQRT